MSSDTFCILHYIVSFGNETFDIGRYKPVQYSIGHAFSFISDFHKSWYVTKNGSCSSAYFDWLLIIDK